MARVRSARWLELVAPFPVEGGGVRRHKPHRNSAAVIAAHREAMERRRALAASRLAAVRRLDRFFRPRGAD